MVSADAAPSASSKAKRFAQMAGAAALSFGLVGTFSLPAYATAPNPEGEIDGYVAPAQTLETTDAIAHPEAEPVVLPVSGSEEGALQTEAEEEAEAEREAKEEAEAEARAQAAQANSAGSSAEATPGAGAPTGNDVPAGAGAEGIVAAALAQLGVMQDCTALVEKSLRAVGIPAGDLGTQIHEYTGLGGTLVTSGDYAPGDVLIWSGRHVAVYIGNGQAVHGGYGGNQTVIAGAFIDGSPSGVVRF